MTAFQYHCDFSPPLLDKYRKWRLIAGFESKCKAMVGALAYSGNTLFTRRPIVFGEGLDHLIVDSDDKRGGPKCSLIIRRETEQ